MCVNACTYVHGVGSGGVPQATAQLQALVPGPPYPRPLLSAASPSRLLWQMFLAVPWQRQNRMYLWIVAGTNPRAKAGRACPSPKARWERLSGSSLGTNGFCAWGQWRMHGQTPAQGILLQETCAHILQPSRDMLQGEGRDGKSIGAGPRSSPLQPLLAKGLLCARTCANSL